MDTSCTSRCVFSHTNSQLDDDFDGSYEGLTNLTTFLGEVKYRGTPREVINSLPTGVYKDWATDLDCEKRCPICLEDVSFTGSVESRSEIS